MNYIPQYPWEEGDRLFASALNAAIANSVAIRGSSTVLDFGAKGDGVTDDTAAIQAAANEGGGMLLFPPGVYVVSRAIAVPSNTMVMGQGATLLAAPTGFVNGPLMINQDSAVTTLTDHDISVRGMTFDFGSSGADGAAHCIDFLFVRNVVVVSCTFQCRRAGDAVALVGCYNTLIDGCTAYGFSNCGYDHWWGPSSGRLTNCYAETTTTNQMVNWNPETTSGTPTGLIAKGFVMANCTLVTTGPNAGVSLLEPLGNGIATDIVVDGNTFINNALYIRGATHNCTIANNVFDAPLGGVSAIASYTESSGSPANIAVTGNVIVNPATVIGNVAVIVLQTSSAVITNNVVIGATVNCLDTGSGTPIVAGNYWSNNLANTPSAVAQRGSMRVTGPLVLLGGIGSSQTDLTYGIDLTGGGFAGINAAPLNGVNIIAAGGGYIGFEIGGGGQANISSNGFVNAASGMAIVGTGATWTSGALAPTSSQPVGSIYSCTGGGLGGRLYISAGGGTWTGVAGV